MLMILCALGYIIGVGLTYTLVMKWVILAEYRETQWYNEGKPFSRRMFTESARRSVIANRTNVWTGAIIWPLALPIWASTRFITSLWRRVRRAAGDLDLAAENAAANELRKTGEVTPRIYRDNAESIRP